MSARKIICTLFWDKKGVLLVDFYLVMTQSIQQRIVRLKKLRRAIQNETRGMLSKDVFLLRDNVRPHTANQTQKLITSFSWEQLDHPPCSRDLAPSDYHLFLH